MTTARRRTAALLALGLAGVIAFAVVAFGGGDDRYGGTVVLADAGGLQNGSNVTVGGVTVGNVTSLQLDSHDHAIAQFKLDRSAAPLGSGARAVVQIEGFFGERELQLTRGDLTHPQPSGVVIPVPRSSTSVRFDDVVDALNPDVQGALRTFLDEQGAALVGRGASLAATLQALPPSLSATGELLRALSSDNQALGDLVVRSDRVVAGVAAQRAQLGRFVAAGAGALDALASRRSDLGATVENAPGALRQAQSTLATLQGTAIPLAPAADGLRAAAPSLTQALRQIPRFASAAVPTLNEVARVSPALQRLADQGTPVVRDLVPFSRVLTPYSSRALGPFTAMLDQPGGAAGLFGVMEGWARATQGYDASSHIFRFGATVGTDTFAKLLAGLPGGAARHSAPHRPAAGVRAPKAAAPAPAPAAPAHLSVPRPLGALTRTVTRSLSGVLGTVQGTLSKLHGALPLPGLGGSSSTGDSSNPVRALLNYLTKP